MTAQIAQMVGSGSSKVMVLHGWFGPSVFDGFFDGFDLSRYEFAIVHNPGYSAAREEAPARDMTDLAQQLLALADSAGWDRFGIIGHSYGGAAALRIASLAPDRIEWLAGLAPVMPSGFDAVAARNTGADANTGPAFMAAFAKGKIAPDGPGMIAAALDPVLAADGQAMTKLMDDLYASINEETYKQYFLVWTGCDFQDAVDGLPTRSLFLLGKADPFCAPNYVAHTVAAMKNAESKVVAGGHFPTLSGAEDTKRALMEFLARE